MSKNHEAEAQLTQERLELSSIEQMIKTIIGNGLSRRPETTLALRSTQLAFMWLGKAKGALGAKHPYPQSFNAESAVIEPRADFKAIEFTPESDETATIKALRALLKKMETSIKNDLSIMKTNEDYQDCIKNAYSNCSNATMWLGMVLNAIFQEEVEENVMPEPVKPTKPAEPTNLTEIPPAPPETPTTPEVTNLETSETNSDEPK
jgi:hypothetical protein